MKDLTINSIRKMNKCLMEPFFIEPNKYWRVVICPAS